MDDLVSIVIPIYNSEKYLNKCVDSLLNQSYRNIEVLLINDGSKDNSLKICEDYKAKDNRVKVFSKENGGVSTARNLGIEKASGKYIFFIDGDDYLSESFLEKEYQMMISGGYETIIGGRIFCKENGDIIKNSQYAKENRQVTMEDIAKELVKNIYFSTCTGILILSEIIKKNNLMYDTKLNFGEDTEFNLKVFKNAKRIGYLADSGYYYVQTGTGVEKNSLEKIFKYMNDNLILFSILKEYSTEEEITNRMYTKLNYSIKKLIYVENINYKLFKEKAKELESIFESNYEIDKVDLNNMTQETKLDRMLLRMLKAKKYKVYFSTMKMVKMIKTRRK